MKQFFSVLMMTMFVASISFAQTSKAKISAKTKIGVAAQAEGPAISFEKTTINYGKIQKNADPYRIFKFTNTGSEALIIKNAKGSCGCTVPTYSKEPIAPGKSGEIKVRYDTKRVGKINKSVTLQTNAGVKILKITGEVLKPETQKAVPAKSQKKSILDQ